MSPIHFAGANRKLLPSGHEYSLNVESIEPLHVFTDGEQCISCWEPTPEERALIASGKNIFVHVISGGTQPPIGVSVQL